MPRRALVTGAHGFIGRHAARDLARAGWHVAGIGHGDWDPAELRAYGIADWSAADIDPGSLRAFGRVDLIIHCAGGASVAASLADPYADFMRGVASTAAILEFARRQTTPPSVVYPSSAAVYGNTSAVPIREDVTPAPVSPYGMHKTMAEDLCRFSAQHGGIPVAIVRLFSAYGAGLRKQLLWDACNKILAGDLTFSGTGEEVRDWIHVDDAAALLVTAAEHASLDAPIVNGGTGIGTPIREILGSLRVLLGQVAGLRFSGQRRPGDPPAYVADIARSQKWGWTPRRLLEDGLADYVRWFRVLQESAHCTEAATEAFVTERPQLRSFGQGGASPASQVTTKDK